MMQVRDYPPLEPSPIRTADNQLSLRLAATLGRFECFEYKVQNTMSFTLQVCVQCYILLTKQVVRKTLASVYKQVMMSCTLLACINLLWVLTKT